MYESANNLWCNILDEILTDGRIIAPRNIKTRELLFVNHNFDMNSPICYHQHRKLNYAFSAAEAYFIAHGDNRTANLVKYNKNMAAFSDDGLIFNGAYGPPFNEQLMYVVNTLFNDLSSRQAVLTIWQINPVTSADVRCTIALQFLVRDGCIHTKVTMRSSDIWLGVPYDLFNFTIMTLRILTLLNAKINSSKGHIQLGTMNFSAGSSHMYMHNEIDAQQVLAYVSDKVPESVPDRCCIDWQYVVDSLIACRDKDEDKIKKEYLWRIRP